MKKKSPRGIPDFAPKRPHGRDLRKLDQKAPPPVPKPGMVKPQSTSAKSGRRGQ